MKETSIERNTAWERGHLARITVHVCAYCVAAAFVFLLPQPARAQSGYYANIVGRAYDGTPEPTQLGFVDRTTGDLHLEFPLGDPSQRGALTTNARIIYDGRIWQIVNNGTSQTWQPTNLSDYGFSTGGWNWTASDNDQSIGYYSTLQYCNQSAYTAYYGPWTVLNHDGTINFITAKTQQDFGCGNQNISSSSAYDQFSHGYFGSITNYTNATVLDHSGNSVSKLEDSNGNNLTVSGGNLVDTLGRTPLAVSNSGLTYTLSVPNAQGSTSSYTVTFTNINVSTSFGVSGVTEYSGTIEVVSSIAFPDGTSYSFGYDSGTSPGHYGELTNVTLRTGGTVTYGWSNFTDFLGNVVHWLTSRSFGGGTWTYSPSVISTCSPNQTGCEQKVTETKPSGDEAVYTYTLNNGAWNTETDYYTGSSTLLKKVVTTYDFSNPCPDCNSGAAYVRPIQVVTSMPSAGGTLNSQVEYSYDSIYYGNVTALKLWNYTSGSFGPTPNRETDYTYVNTSGYISANILNRVTKETIYQGGTQEGQTITTYDSTALTSVTGVTHHDDTNYGTGNTVRGNPTVIQQWVSGSTYLSTTNYYDTTGQLVKTTDPADNSVTYSYADSFSGYTPPAPTNAYVTQVTLPVSGTLKYSYYFGTGQKASATDQNSQKTTYKFNDPLNRHTETDYPDGGWRLINYAANATGYYTGIISTTPSTSCTGCEHTHVDLDSFGRVSDRQLWSDPDGQTNVNLGYDSSGRLSTQTTPFRSLSDPTYGVESSAYDGLNRPVTQTHGDSNVVHTYYGAAVTSGGGLSSQLCSTSSYGFGYPTLTVDEAGHKQQTWTLVYSPSQVNEIDQEDSSGALTLATCYFYDASGNLQTAAQGSQTRSYSYDGLERKTKETTPEAGTVNYYYTNSGGSVCAGDTSKVCRRTDARGITTTYTYDGESRLTKKTYSDSTPTAYFSYDESSVTLGGHNYTMTNGKGRLTHTSIQTNNAFTIDSYGPAGRVVNSWQCTPFNCATSSYWGIGYTYDLAGDKTTWTHPGGFTITQSFSNARRITQISSSLSDSKHPGTLATIHYAPQGAISTLQNGCVGSGCTDAQETYDYNNRLQPVRIQLGTSGSPSSLSCKVYNYYGSVGNPSSCAVPSQGSSNDGNVVGSYYGDSANPTLTHAASFSYDPTHRLTSAVATGNYSYNLTYSFDEYGDATCVQGQNTNGPCPQYSFSSSTNRISNSGYSYDASGDLTGDGTHTYQYDAEGRLISVDNGSTASYIYNALGERVEKDLGGAYSEYVFEKGGAPVGINNRSAWTEDYIPMGMRHVAHYQNGAHFVHSDALGTTTMATSYSGALEQDETRYPWGTQWKELNGSVEERYASLQHRDSETSLDPTHYRMYSSGQYRWLRPDPMQADIFQPQSMSRYGYGRDNPFRFTDPTGLDDGACGYAADGTPIYCTTTYNGYASPGIAALGLVGQEAGYLDTPAPYEAMGGIILGAFTLGSGLPVYGAAVGGFEVIGGGLGIVSGAYALTGPLSTAETMNHYSGLYNVATGVATENYVQVASGGAALLGQDLLSMAIDAAGDEIDAIPPDVEGLQELENLLC